MSFSLTTLAIHVPVFSSGFSELISKISDYSLWCSSAINNEAPLCFEIDLLGYGR